MKKISLVVLCVLFIATNIYASQVVRIAPLTTSIKSSAVTVGATATALPATALVGRESIALYNNDTVTIYIGASDVSTTNGYPLTTSLPAISLDVDDSVVVYGIVASGTANLRVLEAK